MRGRPPGGGALRLELLAGRLRAAEAALQTAAQRLAEAQRQAEDAESHLAAREEELRRAQATAALAEPGAVRKASPRPSRARGPRASGKTPTKL